MDDAEASEKYQREQESEVTEKKVSSHLLSVGHLTFPSQNSHALCYVLDVELRHVIRT